MGLTLPEFRSLIATDLKVTVGTEISQAELNRAVQRTVDDLSRYMPLEKVYEETLSFTVTDESFTTPDTADPDAIVDAADLSSTTAGDTLTITDHTPDMPRRLTVTLTDADSSITQLTVIIKGIDQDGNYIEESWYLSDLVSGTAKQGNLYFKRVIEVEVDAIDGNGASDTLDVGTGNAYDSYVFLDNKPIRPGSETVTNAAGTTTYTRDTDYRMDYINGAVKFINGGDMAAGTSYLIDYTKSRLGLDISSIIPVATRIVRVEYPTNLVPQQFVNFNIYGDFLYIASKKTGQSQEELSTSADHIAIYYERKHMPPSEHSPGSYPDVLDEVVAIGAAGYALLTEAQQHEQQAATDLNSLRTELGLTTSIHTDVASALDKVATYLEDNTSEDAKSWLTKITTDAADLRTALETAVDAVATNLGLVFTTSLDKADTGAEAYLDAGDDKIDAVNIGSRVAESYADYARARSDIASIRVNSCLAYIQEANTRLANLNSYIQQAAGWRDIATGFIAEAVQRIAEINSHLAEASQWAEAVNGDMVLADRFRTEGLARLNEFHNILRNKAEYRKRISSVPVRQPA